LLANIALDGMERLFGIYSSTGRYLSPSQRKGQNRNISIFRYADDTVVIAPTKEQLTDYAIPRIKMFLSTIGLELNQAKSKIVKLTEGFDFLGFHIQQYRYTDGRHKLLYFEPERKRVDKFLTQTNELLHHKYSESVQDIIRWLNRRIVGWANYYKWSMASKMFAYVDSQLFQMLWRWARHKHYRRGAHWIKDHYWKTKVDRHWVFTANNIELISASKLTTDWKRYCKVKILASPFDSTLNQYWLNRKINLSMRS
jgi:RNA-directed DNA polymerase